MYRLYIQEDSLSFLFLIPAAAQSKEINMYASETKIINIAQLKK